MDHENQIPPIHPGEHLADFLEELGVSQYRLAKDLQVPVGRVHEIVHGKRRISADTALRLGLYFGTSPQFWMNLQGHYELEVAERNAGTALRQMIHPLPRSQPANHPSNV